jgi:hypothetical protein
LPALVYAATNPVKDGLVVDYRKWPRLCSRPSDWLASERIAKRPKLFFNDKNLDLEREAGIEPADWFSPATKPRGAIPGATRLGLWPPPL